VTERQRIEAAIKSNEYAHDEYLARYKDQMEGLVRQLNALPPDNPDLSGWRPWNEDSRAYFIDSCGNVSCTTNIVGVFYDRDYNFYETQGQAERAAKRQKLHGRMWQCYERFYGANGWKSDENNAGYVIKTNHLGLPRSYPPDHLCQTGLPVFQTREHCDWVIDRLQFEKLLYSGNKL
jgi:hypothetical protein